MTKQSTRDQIAHFCIAQLRKHPDGLRFSELKRLAAKRFKGVAAGTIHGAVYVLSDWEEVTKPSRGLFQLQEFSEQATNKSKEVKAKHKEQEFYEPFAEWITNELEECTKAIPLGGNVFKDKWGTPDVLGIKKAKEIDMLKFPTEIVSAEIKVDNNGLITAFGQACAYKLFSHKTYIVVPKQSSRDDLDRLDSLSILFGIGLILFDNTKPKEPNFEIRTRAMRHEPDMFYANKYMAMVEKELFR